VLPPRLPRRRRCCAASAATILPPLPLPPCCRHRRHIVAAPPARRRRANHCLRGCRAAVAVTVALPLPRRHRRCAAPLTPPPPLRYHPGRRHRAARSRHANRCLRGCRAMDGATATRPQRRQWAARLCTIGSRTPML